MEQENISKRNLPVLSSSTAFPEKKSSEYLTFLQDMKQTLMSDNIHVSDVIEPEDGDDVITSLTEKYIKEKDDLNDGSTLQDITDLAFEASNKAVKVGSLSAMQKIMSGIQTSYNGKVVELWRMDDKDKKEEIITRLMGQIAYLSQNDDASEVRSSAIETYVQIARWAALKGNIGFRDPERIKDETETAVLKFARSEKEPKAKLEAIFGGLVLMKDKLLAGSSQDRLDEMLEVTQNFIDDGESALESTSLIFKVMTSKLTGFTKLKNKPPFNFESIKTAIDAAYKISDEHGGKVKEFVKMRLNSINKDRETIGSESINEFMKKATKSTEVN